MARKLHEVIRNHTLTAGLSYETDKLTEDSNSDVSFFLLTKHPIRKTAEEHRVTAWRHICSVLLP